MNDEDILIKTTAGANELKGRALKLPQRLRTMLIMVDGTLSVTQLQGAAATLGAPGDFLQTLLQHGLVERRRVADAADASAAPDAGVARAPRTDPERFRAAQKFMNDNVVDALGLRAFFFTLKLEKAATCADLRMLLPEFDKAITKGSGEAATRTLGTRAREILG